MTYKVQLEETYLEYPDPEADAIAVILPGCDHHCPGCHSVELQTPVKYEESNEELAQRLKDFANRAGTNKVVLIGGDPLYSSNIEITRHLVDTLHTQLDFCIYTGYSIEYVKKLAIKNVKFFKCGTFDKNNVRKSEKTDQHFQLASPNQNFYDGEYNLLSENGILNF